MSSQFGGDPFRDLARSTFDFYARFRVSPRLPEAVGHFAEEVGEFTEAVMREVARGTSPKRLRMCW
jgi:hypothetical protein